MKTGRNDLCPCGSLIKNTIEISKDRSNTEELRLILGNKDGYPSELEDIFRDQFALSHSDSFWLDKMKNSGLDDNEIRQFLNKKRDESLYYVNTNHTSQFMSFSSGANYEMGKHICKQTNSHIITNLEYRWKEIEYDRRVNGIHVDTWTPFSKAIQEAELKHLNCVSLADLHRLRTDGYLEDMRAFMRRVWTSCSTGDDFDANNAENLSAELIYQINIANEEWKKIDSNLIKWFGSESILGVIGVSAASSNWLPAVAVAAAGAVNLYQSSRERDQFIARHPAAFFVDSIRKTHN